MGVGWRSSSKLFPISQQIVACRKDPLNLLLVLLASSVRSGLIRMILDSQALSCFSNLERRSPRGQPQDRIVPVVFDSRFWHALTSNWRTSQAGSIRFETEVYLRSAGPKTIV